MLGGDAARGDVAGLWGDGEAGKGLVGGDVEEADCAGLEAVGENGLGVGEGEDKVSGLGLLPLSTPVGEGDETVGEELGLDPALQC